MNRVEAYNLLSAELAAYRHLEYDELVALVGEDTSLARHGAAGFDYTIDVSVRCDDAAKGDIAISGSVTPSDWGSPHDQLTDSFVVAKSGPTGA